MIGKFNEKSDKFDTIYFACKDIEKVEIPNYIEYIKEFSFFRYKCIKSLNFENSNLRIIENESYSYAFRSFLDVTLPPKIEKKIGFEAFDHSKIRELILLKCINLEKIDENAFSTSTVTKVYFPVNLVKICSRAFYCCRNLHFLDFQENSKIKDIGNLSFYMATLYQLVYMISKGSLIIN